MTAHGSLDITIEAIKRGAFYYLELMRYNWPGNVNIKKTAQILNYNRPTLYRN